MIIRRPANLQQGTWLLLLFLLVGIVCPTACLLWFMNDAAESQSIAARQEVLEAYRGQLRLVRDQVNSYWQSEAEKLDTPGRSTPEDFARLVKSGAANSVIILRDDGSPLYPTAPSTPISDPFVDRSDWRQAQGLEEKHNWPAAIGAYLVIAKSDPDVSLAARAAQGQIRGLVASQRQAAAQAILEYFATGKLVNAADLQGRMIAADENLLALHLMPPGDPRRSETLKRLVGWVNNYRLPIPSAQRLFLMGELKAMGVKPGTFPTYEAESLAASALEAGDIRAGFGLEETRVAHLWKLTAKGGHAVGLIKGLNVVMANALVAPSLGVSISLILPGGNGVGESIPAGPMLPGWQIGLTFHEDHSLEKAARQRTARYLWIGYVVIAALCVTGLVLAQLFRRQLRLARLKTDLVAAVSHELKTPLASMRLLVDSLLEDQEFDRRKTREYLALIAGENLRLTRLIENFLTFSRLERNRQHFEFIEVQSSTVVESAVAAVKERFEQPGCRLDVQVDHNLPNFNGDPDALVTVLINLLDNAYKYTRGDKAIVLRAFRADDSIAFEVGDNGIGIAPRDHRRIFQRFYQVDQRLARETGGCGLGLAIVASIVRAHGGRVSVHSQPGEGSVFTVLLPIEIPRQKAAA